MPTVLEEKEAIRELLSAYCLHTDRKNAEARLALFAEDAVWDAGRYGRFEGRDALRGYMAKSAANPARFRHLTLNEMITVSGDTASAFSYVLVLSLAEDRTPVPFSTRFYEDQLVKKDGRWLFKSRVIKAD
jgi:ketosteroid isomerase-like protein